MLKRPIEKLVLSLDEETHSYRPAGHNLLPEQALEQAHKLQLEDRKSLVVDQQGHHRALSFHRCKPCREAAVNAITKHSQTPDQGQPEHEGEVALKEGESESD